ncbi:MAG: 2-keto-4-pentenoate hydratase [Burkholderiaceae bacterium]
MNNIDTLAEMLDNATLRTTAIAPLSQGHELTIDDAYRIQQASIARRAARGERLVGIKMGFTSKAKMIQMGVHDQIWGQLTDAMQVSNGASISLENYIHPRCEPELAFRLKHALSANATEAAALDAIEAVAPAIEIIDSRYEQFKFSLTDVIADNASSSGFVIGDWMPCPADLSGLNVTLAINSVLRQSGSSSAILGNPLRSLMAAARLAAQAGMALQAGWIMLAGAATSAEELKPGMEVDAHVDGMGSVKFSVSLLALRGD